MNISKTTQIAACRDLAASLRWNERNAEASARLLISKALWAGLEISDVVRLLAQLPSATYIRQNNQILAEAFATVSKATQHADLALDVFESLLNED